VDVKIGSGNRRRSNRQSDTTDGFRTPSDLLAPSGKAVAEMAERPATMCASDTFRRATAVVRPGSPLHRDICGFIFHCSPSAGSEHHPGHSRPSQAAGKLSCRVARLRKSRSSSLIPSTRRISSQ
jgi:hypothetical protein